MKTKYKYILIIIKTFLLLRVRAPTDLKFLGIKTCYNSLPEEGTALILAGTPRALSGVRAAQNHP